VRAEPRQYPGGEPGRGGGVFLITAGADDLVQGAERQPTARQGRVDRRRAERQHAMPRRLFEPPDAVAERGQGGGAGHIVITLLTSVCCLFVPSGFGCQPPGFLR
jgi:hypothetical protein